MRFLTRYSLIAAALLGATPLAANDQSGWRLPAAAGGAIGGLHTSYADRSDDGMADIYGGVSMFSQDDLLGGGDGARRVGYRLGAVFPIIDMFEAGVDIAGASVAGLGGISDSMSSFGDIRLRAKYYKRFQALGVAVMPGYNLFQGVQDQSTVADVASPLLGLGVSYFGRECKAPNPLRLHLNATYVYDRTVNFLNGSRNPSRFERLAWQMRDYTYVDGRLGVEYELPKALPIVEYGLEIPANDFDANYLIHTISPGIKFNPWDAMAVMLSADLGFGGDADVAPAAPLYDIALTFSYRFKGAINKPAPRGSSAPAPETTQEASPAPAVANEPSTAPAETAPAATPETAPSEARPEQEIAIPPAIPAPATADTSDPSAAAPTATEAAEPAAPVATPEAPKPTPPPPAKPAPAKKPSGPVSLDQFEE